VHINLSRKEKVTDPYVVILTGGIASGKTAVSDAFGRKGVVIVDTDVIARSLVEPGQPALQKIVASFGQAILEPGGHLNRSLMRELIFADPEKKALLESILHPAIREESRRQLHAASSPYSICVIPLLAESAGSFRGDRVLLIDVDEDTQTRRVMARDGISRNQAAAILAAQATREERQAIANDVIVNEGDLADLEHAVDALHLQYLELAAAKKAQG
jgi:dephospho-CoA kinase